MPTKKSPREAGSAPPPRKRITAQTRDDLQHQLGRTDLLSCDQVAGAAHATLGWLPNHNTIRAWVAKHQMPKPLGYAPFPPPTPPDGEPPYTAMFGKDDITAWLDRRGKPPPDHSKVIATAAKSAGHDKVLTAAEVRDRFAGAVGWAPSRSTLRSWTAKGVMPKPVTHVELGTGGRARAVYDAAEIEAWIQRRPDLIAKHHRDVIRGANNDTDLLAAVRQARTARVSWTQIGGALGITQQAAHQRFKHRLD